MSKSIDSELRLVREYIGERMAHREFEAVQFIEEYIEQRAAHEPPPVLPAQIPPPDGYAYRVNSQFNPGQTVIVFDTQLGRNVIESIPYWLGSPPTSAQPPGDDEPPVMGGALHPIPPPPSGVERIEWHVRQIEIICDALNLDPTEWLMPDLEALDGDDVPASVPTKGDSHHG